MIRDLRFTALAAGALALLPLAAAAAPRYHLVAPAMPPGFIANDVNIRGDVAGTWIDPATGARRAALLRNGVLTVEPEVVGSISSAGTVVTAKGDMFGLVFGGGHCAGDAALWPLGQPMQWLQGCATPMAAHGTGLVVGFTNGIDDYNHCSYWKDGVQTTVVTFWGGNGECEFLAMDARGHYIAGYSDFESAGDQHILRYTLDGGVQDMGALVGYPRARATAVNDQGHVAGGAFDPTYALPSVAIFHDGTTITALTSADQDGWATAINDHDQVVGTAIDLAAPYTMHGMLWAKGHSYELVALIDHPEGWTSLNPGAIGPDGTIAGTGYKDGVQTVFLLEPISR
jgi:uncharacterized membrane protein